MGYNDFFGLLYGYYKPFGEEKQEYQNRTLYTLIIPSVLYQKMSEVMRPDAEYRSWIQEPGSRYRTSQIKASVRVNNEMLMYYWTVGKDITEKHADSK